MNIQPLSVLDDGAVLAADLVIVGAGPAGLTIAAHCAGTGRRVLVLESGNEFEDADHAALNEVESIGQPVTEAQILGRTELHGTQAGFWFHEVQPYGVRCRGLGGSTLAWAGKSAPFDALDFQHRPWVPDSGWPVGHREIEPYVLRAMEELNLCPQEPTGRFDAAGLRSFYWQFARSRVDRLDVMRFGAEMRARAHPGFRILLDASVTRIGLHPDGSRFTHLDVAGICGKRVRVEAGLCVLAAGGIENARLLLVSDDVHARGIANDHDNVGRYLMDHAGTRIAHVPPGQTAGFIGRFGFAGVRHQGRAHMFMHGLALSPETQEREQLLNGALYFAPQHAPDDPWDALKRLIRWRSPAMGHDLLSVARGAGLLAKGLGMKVLEHERTPRIMKDAAVNAAILLSPNYVASEFRSQGLPHKLTGLTIEGICEQAPSRISRIALSARRDRFGVPMASIDWRINDPERLTLLRLSELAGEAFARAGLPCPGFESWVAQRRIEDMAIVDMAHTLGTTRMSADTKTGVVGKDCRVHGLPNLYVAGGSVFPTGGHANPTLMMLALAIRLSDHLRVRLAGISPDGSSPRVNGRQERPGRTGADIRQPVAAGTGDAACAANPDPAGAG